MGESIGIVSLVIVGSALLSLVLILHIAIEIARIRAAAGEINRTVAEAAQEHAAILRTIRNAVADDK